MDPKYCTVNPTASDEKKYKINQYAAKKKTAVFRRYSSFGFFFLKKWDRRKITI